MKKWLMIEILILAVLIVVAVAVCGNLDRPASAPALVQTSDVPEQTTAPVTQEPAPTWMTLPEDRTLTAAQYFVYDCSSESFVSLSGTQNERVYPASITKLFTAYVALQYVQPDSRITAGDALEMVVWGSSVADIEKGDILTAQQLVEAMLLPSGNDAAYLLATEAGRIIGGNPELPAAEAVDVFMYEMNLQAQSVGMTDTHFVNPDGIHDENHYSTFRDLAILGKLAMENTTIMRYANLSHDSVMVASINQEESTLTGQPKEWKNTNALIDPASPYYCPYAVGLKTGQTPTAGSCLLSAFASPMGNYIIGVFGCPEVEDRFADTLQLFNRTIGK